MSKKPLSEQSVDELMQRWDTLAMMADDLVSRAYTWGDVDAQDDIESYERSMDIIEAELNSRGLGLNKQTVAESIEEMKSNGHTFEVRVWLSKTETGNAEWQITNLDNHESQSGTAKTLTLAHADAYYAVHPDQLNDE